MANIRVAPDAEVVDLGERVKQDYSHLKSAKNRERVHKRNEEEEKKFTKKRVKTDSANSYASENITKHNWEKKRKEAQKKDPGFTPGKVWGFSDADVWDENGRLKRKGA